MKIPIDTLILNDETKKNRSIDDGSFKIGTQMKYKKGDIVQLVLGDGPLYIVDADAGFEDCFLDLLKLPNRGSLEVPASRVARHWKLMN